MKRLRLTTGGESHGPGLTALLTGVPAGLELNLDALHDQMRRRMHGYGRGNRMKIETDAVEIHGGVRGSVTLGSPIVLWIANRDFKNWEPMMSPVETVPHRVEQRRLRTPRPGHADLSGGIKYGHRDLRNVLERASARETAARVAAGSIARQLLEAIGVRIRSGVRSLGPIGADAAIPTWTDLEAMDDGSPLRAVDSALEAEMIQLVDRAKDDGDTLGGSVTVIARGLPPGLGSHVQWDEKLDGRLAQALLAVPAVKGVEIGAAVAAAGSFGSDAHDPILPGGDGVWPRTSNRAGGLEGGVTNGQDLVLTLYMKPISTLRKGLGTVDLDTGEATLNQYERSDVTALPAAGVVGEAMVALILADALLEKAGGDSMTELRRHLDATLELQRGWPAV